MGEATTTGVIGAGVAGLAAAARLGHAGRRVVVWDKSKGLGGRLATRRGEAGDFDHGAPGFTVTRPDFAAVVEAVRRAGGAVAWPGAGRLMLTTPEGTPMTGLPGASGFARTLAGGLAPGTEIVADTTVEALARDGDGWLVAGRRVDRLVVAIPAPQAAALLGPVAPDLAARAAAVEMVPVLTAMLGVSPALAPDAWSRAMATPMIARAILHSAKPGRDPAPTQRWVVHASAAFSRTHVDAAKPEIAMTLAAAFSAAVGGAAIGHMAGHRWRYAYADRPLGEASPGDAMLGLQLAGDWCLGRGVEDAWVSGHAAAGALLG